MALFGMLVCAAASGCATRPASTVYGNFTQQVPEQATTRFVGDALQQLTSIYPPARTQLNVQQDARDAFGSGLVHALRRKGYAVLEGAQPTGSAERSASSADASGVPLRYVLDRPGNAEIYRLAVFVGSKTLTRAYLANNNTATPAGAWLRKE